MRVLQDFKETFRSHSKENKMSRANMSKKVEDVIVEKLLEAESASKEVIYDSDANDIGIFDRNIVYHLSGFLCHKAKRLIKCGDCVFLV